MERRRSDVHAGIARRVRALRGARGLTLETLAARSGVSRSMISLIERGEASPTAIVLDKLAAGLSVALAALFEGEPPAEPAAPLARRAAQPVWRDPGSGYRRRSLSPPRPPSPLQLVEVSFPSGARVAFETGARAPRIHQQVWLIAGRMDISVGPERHRLVPGDCLAMRLDRPVVFRNPGRRPARYLVATVAQ